MMLLLLMLLGLGMLRRRAFDDIARTGSFCETTSFVYRSNALDR
jgi:hypothetical protein